MVKYKPDQGTYARTSSFLLLAALAAFGCHTLYYYLVSFRGDESNPGFLVHDLSGGPLPTRVPGQHLSHHPAVTGDAADADADPMRPYRVHELLTRHTQGKQRGRAEQDDDAMDVSPELTVPDALDHAQEDGR